MINSRTWCRDTGAISLSAKLVRNDGVPDLVEIVFSDTGCGIPAEKKEWVFRPLCTTSPHGTGLGLAIVRSIVEAHEGTVIEDGAAGSGVRFRILLPSIADTSTEEKERDD